MSIKRLIQSHKIDEDVDKAQQLLELGHHIDSEALHAEMTEMAAMERARRRQQQAVPIVLRGASNSRLCGTYEPVDEICSEWPVYSLRGDRDIWMVLVGDEWLVQYTKDKGVANKALVRMSCVPHCWPELRADGVNGISEYHEVLGIYVPVNSKSKICIVTEAEAGGLRASKLFKLAEASEVSSTPLSGFLDGDLNAVEDGENAAARPSSSRRFSFSLLGDVENEV